MKGDSLRSFPGHRSACYLVRAGVACHYDPVAAALGVIPMLTRRPCDVVAQVDVFVEAGIRCRACRCGVAAIDELMDVAFTAIGAGDAHLAGLSMEIGLGALAFFVYQVARRETVEPIGCRDFVRPICCE